MRLVLSGGWLQKEGLYQANIKKLHLLDSLEELKPVKLGFLLLSYHYSSKTLDLPIRHGSYPLVVFLELEDVSPFYFNQAQDVKLNLLSSSFDARSYASGVSKVREIIAQGVVYQLNLTCRFDFELSGSITQLFLQYYRKQPVPFAFLLDLDQFYLLSGSMELFLEKRGSLVRSKPIKGTSNKREWLVNSQKDKAENLMITDMVRNDLSKVALPGTVKVEELFRVEEFRTLFQMHSSVVARTNESVVQILKATFPPASVVGAPKRKAVEMIDQIEPHLREYYCGCAGLVFEKDFTLSVLIRTALGSGRELSYYSGAGIVWDSVPEREWQEVLLKTKAFYDAF
ncbi:MAG: chorismate-binding protein [Aquificaceae bacterium]|nr:chorismate-binding protein [Aquificaceae bacterium]